MGFLLGLKAKMWALGAGLLALAAMLAKMRMLEHQRDKANARAVVAEAERDQIKSNTEIADMTRSERREQRKKAVEQIAAGKVPSTLGADLNNFD